MIIKISDNTPTGWTPVPDDEATSLIGEGVHTGLRKGTDAEDAPDLWRAISNSNTTAWSDAIHFAISGLASVGYRVCKVVTK